MDKKTLKDFDFEGKTVIVRVDYNVPLGEERILDDTRIQASLPTIQYLQQFNTKIILISHLGRPLKTGKKNVSLQLMAWRLARLLGNPVTFVPDCIGKTVKAEVDKMDFGEILMLENLRFYPEEEGNDLFFAKELSSFADIYVNDAFGTAHREHASTYGIPKFLPSAAGFLMQKEIEMLQKVAKNPKKPFAVISGGAKIGEKIELLNALMPNVDSILIGGGIANTFLKAQGYTIGASLCEDEALDNCKEFLKKAEELGKKILLPIDVATATVFDKASKRVEKNFDEINNNDLILDIGTKTIALFTEALKKSQTIFWNGSLGVTEFQEFCKGSREIAEMLANESSIRIIGGGDTAGAIQKFELMDKFDHVSTGGGASLKFVEAGSLPCIEVLDGK